MTQGKKFIQKTVNLVDVATEVSPGVLELDGFEFRGCTVDGPAVLMLQDGITIQHCSLATPMFWEVNAGQAYSGAIAFRNSTFDECTFRNVGFAGGRDTIEAFFA